MKEIEITFQVFEPKSKKVKIKLPVYRKYIVSDNSVVYTKITEDQSAVNIHKTDLGYAVEIENIEKLVFDKSSLNYYLGTSEYNLSEQEFNKIFTELQEFVTTMANKTLT